MITVVHASFKLSSQLYSKYPPPPQLYIRVSFLLLYNESDFRMVFSQEEECLYLMLSIQKCPVFSSILTVKAPVVCFVLTVKMSLSQEHVTLQRPSLSSM